MATEVEAKIVVVETETTAVKDSLALDFPVGLQSSHFLSVPGVAWPWERGDGRAEGALGQHVHARRADRVTSGCYAERAAAAHPAAGLYSFPLLRPSVPPPSPLPPAR